MLLNLRQMIVAAVLGVAALTTSVGTACDSYYRPPTHHCSYEKVISYKYEKVAYAKWIVVYDAYGCPHKIKQICYRTVKVPVVHYVKICR